jgi:two-component system nitrate/nitrite response regulator NarL
VAVAKGRAIVLVVDDDAVFRTLVRTLLERASFRVEEAVDVDGTLAAVEETPPHLVLLDVRLPQTSGYEIYRQLRERCGSALPIIFVSGERTDAYDRSAGLLLGADDYLIKPFDPGELIARVQRALRPSRNGRGTASGRVRAEVALETLTPREREVLALLAAGRSSAQIAHDLLVTPRTLGTHIQHILAKLDVHTRTQAVVIAHQAELASPDAEVLAETDASSSGPQGTSANRNGARSTP